MDDLLAPDEPVELLVCATCGTPLVGDPDDEPDGDAGLPMCGGCERSRDFDAILEARESEHWSDDHDEDDR